MPAYGSDWESLTTEFGKYLRFERNLSSNTIESYLRDVAQLRYYIENNYDIPPAAVGRNHIESFMSEIYDRGLKPTTQARTLSGINSFFNFLRISEISDSAPTEFIDKPKMGRKLPEVLSIEEIDAILGLIDLGDALGHRNKAIIETLYSCGLRVSELVTLRLSDLFFDEGFIRVTGKGDKQRIVPVSDEARKNIELWLEQRQGMSIDSKYTDTVFLNRRGKRLTRVMIFTIIRRAAEAAGITKPVSPHTFRHSFATHLLEGGASIRQIQEMLGHESILTTEIYTHLDRSHLRKTLEKHHPLG